jgi:hypothetical protein
MKKEIFGNYKNTWRPNDTLLKELWVTEETKKEI